MPLTSALPPLLLQQPTPNQGFWLIGSPPPPAPGHIGQLGVMIAKEGHGYPQGGRKDRGKIKGESAAGSKNIVQWFVVLQFHSPSVREEGIQLPCSPGGHLREVTPRFILRIHVSPSPSYSYPPAPPVQAPQLLGTAQPGASGSGQGQENSALASRTRFSLY